MYIVAAKEQVRFIIDLAQKFYLIASIAVYTIPKTFTTKNVHGNICKGPIDEIVYGMH